MSLFASAINPSSTGFVASATLTSLSVLQALSSAGLSLDFHSEMSMGQQDALLRETLSPLRTMPEHVAHLAMSDGVQEEFGKFLDTEEHEPSQNLLTALHGKAHVIHGILSGTTTGSMKRDPLQFKELSETARAHHDVRLRKAVDRMVGRINEGARTSRAGVPTAISMKHILEHPEEHRGDKPLEIVLFDVDGTTHLGETGVEGQYSLEWLARDIARYGPMATAGLSWGKVLKALPGIVKLRYQEMKSGHADKEKFAQTIAPLIRGLDGDLARESIDRFYSSFGSRGTNEFMKDEFDCHRQGARLVIGASASPEYLVQLHAENDLDIPPENMLGTTIDLDINNKGTGKFRWLHGAEKVVALEERVFGPLREKGIKFSVVAGYSDSPSDKPMLDLVREDGGIVYATNTSKDDFKNWALENGGMDVEEKTGWWSPGSRRVTIFSSRQAGELSHTMETPAKRPEWVKDLGHSAIRAVSDGLGMVMATPVAHATHQALEQGHVEWSLGLFSSASSMAVAGMMASAATAVFLPADGPVAWERRVVLRGFFPVTAAMAAGGMFGSSVTAFTAALVAAMMASAGAELVTVGERLTGLRKWQGGDERRNPIGKTIGFAGLRAIQFAAFQTLIYSFQHLFGR